MRKIREYELTRDEKNLVNALWQYYHLDGASEDYKNNIIYDTLDYLLWDFVHNKGYKRGLGETPDWGDNYESIQILFDERYKENEEKELEQLDEKYGNKNLTEVENETS